MMSLRPLDDSFMEVRKIEAGCDVPEIIRSMSLEQRDHEHMIFGATYIKYRKVVAEWMVDVCEYFTLHATTTHAAIAYLDRLQPNEKFSRFEWQMLAICCILIASKYNECEDHVPDLSTLEEITQQTIPNDTVLNYELWALKRMGWKLNARTPMAFLSSYCTLGLLLPSDQLPAGPSGSSASDPAHRAATEERLRAHCQSMATACCLDVRFKSHKATDVAAAIVYHARSTLGVSPAWRPELTVMTQAEPTSAPAQAVLTLIAAIPPKETSASKLGMGDTDVNAGEGAGEGDGELGGFGSPALSKGAEQAAKAQQPMSVSKSNGADDTESEDEDSMAMQQSAVKAPKGANGKQGPGAEMSPTSVMGQQTVFMDAPVF